MPISNQELASQIGTVRELVSRNLSRFQSEGLVKIDGRSVTIHDLKALESELRSADWFYRTFQPQVLHLLAVAVTKVIGTAPPLH